MKQALKLVGVAALGFALLLSAGCGGGDKKAAAPAPAKAPEKITLKFGHLADEKNTWHLGALKFKEIVEKNSNGRLEVRVYPNEQLGKEKDLVTSIQNGTADIGIFGETLTTFGASKTILMATPYLLKDSAPMELELAITAVLRGETYLSPAVSKGVLAGDVYLVGGADPVLDQERVSKLLRRLRGLGIERISGDIVLDASVLRLPAHDPDAFDETISKAEASKRIDALKAKVGLD